MSIARCANKPPPKGKNVFLFPFLEVQFAPRSGSRDFPAGWFGVPDLTSSDTNRG
jgi:hypothetical protein